MLAGRVGVGFLVGEEQEEEEGEGKMKRLCGILMMTLKKRMRVRI